VDDRLDELDSLTHAIGIALDGWVMTREELAQKVGQITGSKKFAAKLAYGSWGTLHHLLRIELSQSMK
jgi:hypothetical protein